MPTYEYECETCGHQFELFQSMNDRRLSRCPADVCPARVAKSKGKGKVRRLLGTGAGLIFKGSGFYETDYRSDSYKKGAEKAASAEKESSSSSGDKKKDKKKSSSDSKKSAGSAAKGGASKKSAS
jgi:putative FmdB family regulatory protein